VKGRETKGHVVFGFCAALVCLGLLAGCGTSREGTDRDWTPIGRPVEVGSKMPSTIGFASPHDSSRRAISVSQSPFSNYDRAFVDTVEQRWNDILKHGSFPPDNGEVVLRFTLNSDGSVSEMQVIKSTLNEQATKVCWRAIQEPAPYPPWTPDMRKQIGEKRSIVFTFNYLK